MRNETRTLYLLSELSPKAREKAIDHNRSWNVEDTEWWDGAYDDAERMGLKITAFDLGRRSMCEGHFLNSGKDVAEAIIKEHGPDCETAATAQAFLKDLASLPLEDGENCPSDDDMEKCEKYFLQRLL